MTKQLAGALATGALLIGILVGAAGAVLVHDATRPGTEAADMGQMMDMGDMGQMMDMGDRGQMTDMDGMGQLMAAMHGGGMQSGATGRPDDHRRHHGADE